MIARCSRSGRGAARCELAVIARVGVGRRRRAADARAAADGVQAARPARASRSITRYAARARRCCATSLPVFVEPRRRADQRATSTSGSRAASPTSAPSRCSPTRRRSTCCRSACSACRCPRPSCRRCRATRGARSEVRERLRDAARRGAARASRSSSCRRRSAFIVLGDAIVGAAARRAGGSRATDTRAHVGHPRRLRRRASSRPLGRLYSSTFYALRDTRTPFRFALVRVVAHRSARLRARVSAAARARPRPR